MNVVLLSGGSGKRLWPLSNDIRSKQFIKIFKNDNNEYESMLQKTYKLICKADKNANVTIATSKSQVSSINNQLGDKVSISIEPCRKDTFPAIALTAAYLHDVKGMSEEESIAVCPVDHYVNEDYFIAIKKLTELAKTEDTNLVLIGIEPTYPSEKYGYIIPENNNELSNVVTFKEKPDEKIAKEYIKNNALWNAGIFAFKLKYILKKAHELIDFKDYNDLLSKYETLEKISFDYAVVEKEKNIKVMRFSGQWKDLGTWNTLTEAMDENIVGNAVLNNTCKNVHVINELDVPILCMGLQDVVVSASPEGIIVSDKIQSSHIKPYVDNFNGQVMFAEKSWGSFKVIDIENESLTIKVSLKAGHKMNYHSHEKRDEVWTIIEGVGKVIINGKEQKVKMGDVVSMKAGCPHTIMAQTNLKLIEVQMGKDISVKDKKKVELDNM